ncbi:MAG: hypothetical protein EA377_08210 [Phycisphaerales bacterium]|nr:MAG: hypothetical protein EA377_08210 [Phycisphaerales bacterium]
MHQFGRVPYAVVTSGAIAYQKPGAVKVYLQLCAHVNRDWTVHIGMRRLADLSGMMIGSVSRSTKELEDAGLITIDRPGPGSAYSYTISTSPPSNRSRVGEQVTVRAPENGTPTDRSRLSEQSGIDTVRASVNGQKKNRSPVRNGTVRARAQNRSRASEQNRMNREKQSAGANAPAPKQSRQRRNRLWDAVAEEWFGGEIPKPQAARAGKIVNALRDYNATPADLTTRIERYRRSWPNAECTPEAIVKHWHRFGRSDSDELLETGPCTAAEVYRMFAGAQQMTSSNSIDATRTDQAALLNELREAGCDIKSPNCIRCEFHSERNPSAGIYRGDDGVWRYKCHACGLHGDIFDIRAHRTGRPVADLLREERGVEARPSSNGEEPITEPRVPAYPTVDDLLATIPGTVEAIYKYTDPASQRLDLLVIRWMGSGKKQFCQGHQIDRGFVKKAPPKPWPLYNRARVNRANTVIVVEGEKCVHALHDLGLIATTNPGGAGKAAHADWTPLAGKAVYLWPEADPVDKHGKRPGIAHMREVERILRGLTPPARLHWIDPDTLGLPPKGDVADLLERLGDEPAERKRLAVEEVLDAAQPLGASADVLAYANDVISGRRRAVSWPWSSVSPLTAALLPGTVSIVCGEGGSGKSFWILQAAQHWHAEGERVAVLELEEDHTYHLYRALAQRSGCARLTDASWMRDHADEAREIIQREADWIDEFGHVLHEPPAGDALMQLGDVVKWIERMAEAGNRVIVVDPVTAAATSDKPWIEDQRFVMHVKRIAREFECSIVLITHPRKGRKSSALMEDLAGGAAYTRFASTVLWLEHKYPAKTVSARRVTPMGGITDTIDADRILRILKSRNGPGGGRQLAFTMNTDTLTFAEHGVVIQHDGGDTDA